MTPSHQLQAAQFKGVGASGAASKRSVCLVQMLIFVCVGEAPSLAELRQGAYTTEGEERMQQFTTADTPVDFHERRRARKESIAVPTKTAIAEKVTATGNFTPPSRDDNLASIERIPTAEANDDIGEKVDRPALVSHPTVYDLQRSNTGTFPNGYRFPPKHNWKEATSIGFKAFIKFTFGSWVGFLIIFYAVQVVGWGGMIFLLLCGAGGAYFSCTKTDVCGHPNSVFVPPACGWFVVGAISRLESC